MEQMLNSTLSLIERPVVFAYLSNLFTTDHLIKRLVFHRQLRVARLGYV